MESGRVGDGLDVVYKRQVFVASRNGRELAVGEAGNRRRERVSEVRVLRPAPIARPITRVDGQLHEICQTADLLRSGGFAAGQRAELIQIDGLRTLRSQVGVDESEMGEFILGVVMDVLGHVPIEHLERLRVSRAAGTARYLAILDAAELVVLLPQIGLKDLRGSKESQYGRIAYSDSRLRFGERRQRNESGTGRAGTQGKSGP